MAVSLCRVLCFLVVLGNGTSFCVFVKRNYGTIANRLNHRIQSTGNDYAQFNYFPRSRQIWKKSNNCKNLPSPIKETDSDAYRIPKKEKLRQRLYEKGTQPYIIDLSTTPRNPTKMVFSVSDFRSETVQFPYSNDNLLRRDNIWYSNGRNAVRRLKQTLLNLRGKVSGRIQKHKTTNSQSNGHPTKNVNGHYRNVTHLRNRMHLKNTSNTSENILDGMRNPYVYYAKDRNKFQIKASLNKGTQMEKRKDNINMDMHRFMDTDKEIGLSKDKPYAQDKNKYKKGSHIYRIQQVGKRKDNTILDIDKLMDSYKEVYNGEQIKKMDKQISNKTHKTKQKKKINQDAMEMDEATNIQMKKNHMHGHMKEGMKMDMSHRGMDMDKMKRLMEGYKYHVMLDITSKLMFCWNVNYSNKTVSIRITCQLPPNYWFGVGFSDYGEVTNADFVVFWNDPVDVHHLQDSYSDDKGILHSDPTQDYTLHRARTEDGLSVLEYTRPFDTCDDNDYLLDNGTTHIVYFVSEGTPASCEGKDVRKMRHGLQRVQLLKPDVHLPPLPPDVWTFDILAPQVKVPSQETTYWWYITTLPILNHKQHIIRYEGVIEKKNEDIVHHIEVFHCVGRKHVRPYSGPKVAEGKMSPSSDLARCRNVIGAWAMGAEPIIYPEEAGSPIGGEGFSPYILLEVHYHNPHLKAGHVDSSGVRFYVTPTLRQYDMGIMELGLEYTDKMVIPPKQSKFLLSGYCIDECTRTALPPGGINIVASQLHTHLTGKRVWTKHVRNGRELPEVNRDDHYSPHFQEVRALPHPVNILPGDALITECEDSTASRENVTYGGFSITEEMCVNYVHYYPKVDLEVCKSSISDHSLQNFFYFMKRMEGVSISDYKGIKYNYAVIPWFPLNVNILNYIYQTSPISMQCNQSNGQRFPGDWEGVPVTKIVKPLITGERECEK